MQTDISLNKLSSDLWECLSKVRRDGKSTKDEVVCMKKYYKQLSRLINNNLDNYSEEEVWFSQVVLEAYQDLSGRLKL